MMKRFLPLLLLVSCAAPKVVVQERVEVREHTEYITDTAYISVPDIREVIATRDSSSHLENEWAVSDAEVSSGVLTHSLSTKPNKHRIEYQKEVVYRDSLVYVTKVEEVQVEKALSWWEGTKVKFGGWAMLVIVLMIVITVVIRFRLW